MNQKAKNKKQEMLISWIERCKDNMVNFKNNYKNMTIEEKVDFSRRQYYLLYLLNNVLTGKSKLEGADINNFKLEKQLRQNE
ncbi:MAG: hypothetical protein H8D97_00050 [Proteobacteria bacterium]|nr:hypothetical protein [Pseudomonadota bacterium]